MRAGAVLDRAVLPDGLRLADHHRRRADCHAAGAADKYTCHSQGNADRPGNGLCTADKHCRRRSNPGNACADRPGNARSGGDNSTHGNPCAHDNPYAERAIPAL